MGQPNAIESTVCAVEGKNVAKVDAEIDSTLIGQALDLLKQSKGYLTVNPLTQAASEWGTCTGKSLPGSLPEVSIGKMGEAAAAAAAGAIVGGVGGVIAGRVPDRQTAENVARGVVAGVIGGVAGGIAGGAAERAASKALDGAAVVGGVIGGAAGAGAQRIAKEVADGAALRAAEGAITAGAGVAGSAAAEAIRIILGNQYLPVVTKDLKPKK